MKKYNIKVNGKVYEVEVEMTGTDGVETMPVSASVQSAPPAAVAEPKAVEVSGTTGTVKIVAPMPGTILKVNVKVGDKVSKGQVICVLEAMKMENEISASADGTIVSINVSTGATVESGALLASLN